MARNSTSNLLQQLLRQQELVDRQPAVILRTPLTVLALALRRNFTAPLALALLAEHDSIEDHDAELVSHPEAPLSFLSRSYATCALDTWHEHMIASAPLLVNAAVQALLDMEPAL